MLNSFDILETIKMIEDEHLDIRTITMGISLLDCITGDINTTCDKVYDKITRKAEHLVETGEQIEAELGIPIIHKRISVTPIAMIRRGNRRDFLCAARTDAGSRSGCPAVSTLSADSPRLYRRALPRAMKF